jgi:hypothetical protein
MHGVFTRLALCISPDARTPGFSLTAVLSLALGIGATVSVFSVIYSAVLNAWPTPGSTEFVRSIPSDKAGHEGGRVLPGRRSVN